MHTLSINDIVMRLRSKLADVKFDDIGNNLMSLHGEYIIGTGYRRIDDDVIDVDIFCNDTTKSYYIVTLRRIVNYYPIPKNYITINKDTTMADNVEVYVGDVSLTGVDVIHDSNTGYYMLEVPISIDDVNYPKLNNSKLIELFYEIVTNIKDTDNRIAVLELVRDYIKR